MGEGKEGTEEGEKVEMGEEEEGKDLLPLQQHYYKQETETITSPPTPPLPDTLLIALMQQARYQLSAVEASLCSNCEHKVERCEKQQQSLTNDSGR